jgi:Sec-independent protein translocase protein (TatC)
MRYLLGLTPGGVQNLIQVGQYMSFVMTTMPAFGLAFEVPLFIVVLKLAGILTHERFRKWHRVLIFAGIVSLRSQRNLPALLEILRSGAVAQVEVSPVYTGLERTSQALHLARIVLACSSAGDPMVNVFDDAPLPALVASSPTTSYQITKTILGPLLDINLDERDMLPLCSSRSRAPRSRQESTCTATPTRCATSRTTSSV